MKAKQLPGGLDEWLKTRTIVIGAVNWLKANENRRARGANDNERTPKPSSIEKTPRIPAAIKLLPLLKFERRLPDCCARPKSQSR